MTDWISLSPDDLLDFAPAAELAELQDPLEPSLVTDIIYDVVARARAEIVSGGHTCLDVQANTIPPELRAPVAQLVLAALRRRAPEGQAEPVSEAAQDAAELLVRIAQGKLVVSAPNTPAACPAPTAVSLLRYREEPLTSDHLQRL